MLKQMRPKDNTPCIWSKAVRLSVCFFMETNFKKFKYKLYAFWGKKTNR